MNLPQFMFLNIILKFVTNNHFFLQVVLAVLVVAAQSGIIAPGYAGLPLGYAGAPLGYAGAPLAYAGAPLAYAGVPVAAPIAVAPAPAAYALPPVREIAEAPIVQTAVEPVEQHGYSVRY